MSEPRTEAGRALLGLDMTPESGYWVNLGSNAMSAAIVAIEAEARATALAERPRPVRIQRKRTKGWRMPEGAVFMGVGATIRAAKDRGRKAIGIEIEERYCEIAATRCRQEVLGLVG